MDLFDIVMEARRKKSEEAKPADNQEEEELPDDVEPTDYSDDSETPEDPDTDDPPEDDEPTDYTEDDNPEESDTEEPVGDEEPPDDEPTDYSEEGGGVDDPDGGDNSGTDDPPPNDEPTDYTNTSGDTDNPDEDTGEGDVETPAEENPLDDPRLRLNLLEDFTDLFNRCKDVLVKVDNIDRTDIIVNQVVNQVKKNISRIKQVTWNYVSYDFNRNNYVMNLYSYNQLIEAFKLNIDMLANTKAYIVNRQEKEEKATKNAKTSTQSKNS